MTAPTVLFYQFLQYQFTEIYKYGLRINVGSCLREYMEKTVSQSIWTRNHRESESNQ